MVHLSCSFDLVIYVLNVNDLTIYFTRGGRCYHSYYVNGKMSLVNSMCGHSKSFHYNYPVNLFNIHAKPGPNC